MLHKQKMPSQSKTEDPNVLIVAIYTCVKRARNVLFCVPDSQYCEV
jgi:hypothetical protein